MTFMIGVDEAGYGPNLGPLVVASSYWQVSTAEPVASWQRDFHAAWNDRHGHDLALAIDDSKKLFGGARDLAKLETVVLSCLPTLSDRVGSQPRSRRTHAAPVDVPLNWTELCAALRTQPDLPRDYDESRVCLPISEQTPAWLPSVIDRWRCAQQCASVQLCGVRCTIVFPKQWNLLLDQWQNKSTVLSRLSLELLANVLHDLPDGADVRALCDKHGGRNHYAALLSDSLAVNGLLHTVREGNDASEYRLQHGNQSLQIGFYRQGESFLPVALASMVAKYVREVAMAAFNSFWRKHVPHLKPTAGYPVDARRFASEVGSVRKSLDIDEQEFWRTK